MSAQTLPQERTESEDTGVFLRPWKREEFAQASALGWFGVEPMELVQGHMRSKRSGEDWHWTRERFQEAVNLEWFLQERVERIKGEIYHKVTQNPPHSTAILRITRVLNRLLQEDFVVRPQMPFPLPNDGDPEPDILVANGEIEDYVTRHPDVSEAVLVVEVSDTTLRYDRRQKAALYAEAGIADYWIINLNNRTLEVRRGPARKPNGWDYANRTVYTETQSLALLALPEGMLSVVDLLSNLPKQI